MCATGAQHRTGDFHGDIHVQPYLNNGPIRQSMRVTGAIGEYLAGAKKPIAEPNEPLSLTRPNRGPAPNEPKTFTAFLDGKNSPSDSVWVLINSSEFRFNH